MVDKIISKLKHWFLPCRENNCRPIFLRSRFLYYYAVLLLVFKIFIISLFFYLPQTTFFADITKTSLVQMTNEVRQSEGFPPLISSSKLDEAALLKAQDMLANDYFSHNSPVGITPWYWFSEAGYDYKYAGENLAIGFIDSSEVNQAWLDSPSHRKNILNDKYTEIGMAVLAGEFQGGQTTIVVQLFGTQKIPAVAAVENLVSLESTPEMSPSPENSAAPAPSGQVAGVPPKEVLSAFTAAEGDRNFLTKFFSFLVSDSNLIFQKIIYGSLFLIIFLLVVAVLVDIFVYRAYEIQHKDIFLKALVLCAVFVLLLFLDKETIISLIPHNLGIY